MENKACSNCGKFMIEWKDDVILCSFPPKVKIDFKCACGNSEFSRFEVTQSYTPSFENQWKKANGE